MTVEEALAARDPIADFARCKPWLVDALEYADGTHTIDDVIAGIATGQYHFWAGERSAAITEIYVFPQARWLNVFLAGGDLSEIVQVMEPRFVSWGRHLGCTRLVMAGRPGWEKVLKAQDWQRRSIVLTKEIETGANG